jgi:hypothetical protein
MIQRVFLALLLLAALDASAQTDGVPQDLLRRAGLASRDLAFPLLPQERDSLRLQRVDQVLKEGLDVDAWADSLTRRTGAASSLSGRMAVLGPELTRAGGRPSAWAESTAPSSTPPEDWEDWIRRLTGLARTRLLEPEAVRVLEQDLGDLLQEDAEQEDWTVFELDSLLRLSERESAARKARLEAAQLPDPVRMSTLLVELDSLLAWLPRLVGEADGERPRRHPVFGPVLHADEWVAIGTEAVNTWTGDLPPVIVDLGGDDLYEGPVALTRGGVSLALDLQGDDRYRPGFALGPAASVGGLALLADLAGDDDYQGHSVSLGAALGGVAILLDRSGNDRYQAESFALGAGSLGWGLLLDASGDDLYRCSLYGQGFGHLAGLGLLQDDTGHDQYLMLPQVVDQIRYDDHHLSMGQGFGFGLRPDLSGGIGVLHDRGGNDLYSADIFGQGGSYWWALGALVDRAGNDRYLAWQYAQGSGVHLAAAVLRDDGGQDVYQSRGVSQGCGHDLALGRLVDLAGDDSYTAWDLSQGAGSANGAGWLLDLAGSDLYAMRGPSKPRAYGDPRRRTGSLGLFHDAAGPDFYLGPGANDSLWAASLRGFAMDVDSRPPPAPAPSTVSVEEAAETGWDPLFRADDPVERLYVWAIRLEPKWARERDEARRLLRERGTELIAFLSGRRLLASEISWERHALKEVVAALGDEALPLLEAAVADSLGMGEERRLRLSERGFALWVLSENRALAGPETVAGWLAQGVGRDEPGQKALLLECLAERGGSPAPLHEALGHGHAGVRRSAAWGLGRLPASEEGRSRLLAALADSVLAVRMAAFGSLAGDSLLPAVRLEALLMDPAGPSVQRRELLGLLARLHPARCRELETRWLEDPDLREAYDWVRKGLPDPPVKPVRRRSRR